MRGYAEVFTLLVLLFVGFAVLFGLPAVGLWWLAKWLQRRQYRRAAVAVQILLVGFGLLCLSTVYSFYFPFDSEFEYEFVKITGLPFPTSGKVVDGEISGLDLQGQYFATAKMKTNQQDYLLIRQGIDSDTSFHSLRSTSAFADSSSYQTFEKHSSRNGPYRSIGFWKDGRTISFYYRSN